MKKFKCEFCDFIFTQEKTELIIPACPNCGINFDVIANYDCPKCETPLSSEETKGSFCNNPKCKQYNNIILTYS